MLLLLKVLFRWPWLIFLYSRKESFLGPKAGAETLLGPWDLKVPILGLKGWGALQRHRRSPGLVTQMEGQEDQGEVR